MSISRKEVINKEVYCPHCGKDLSQFRITDAGNHVKNCNYQHNPQLKEVYANKIRTKVKLKNNEKYGYYKQFTVKCHKCQKQFTVTQRQKQFPKKEKYFCSLSCANSRVFSQETIEKIKNTLHKKRQKISRHSKQLWKNEQYVNKQLNRPRFYTSKGQRKIRDYIVQNYKQDQWTWGSLALYKDEFMLNPDLFSHKLKFVFQYDGEWHFKDIRKDGTFEKTQYKDKCLEDWCRKNNYFLLRISQSWFQENKKDEKLVFSIINQMLNQNNAKYLKLGKQYINSLPHYNAGQCLS